MPEMGAHMTDIKSISDDSCRHWGKWKRELDETRRLFPELLLADGQVRTIEMLLVVKRDANLVQAEDAGGIRLTLS
jgi:hypothetical protein